MLNIPRFLKIRELIARHVSDAMAGLLWHLQVKMLVGQGKAGMLETGVHPGQKTGLPIGLPASACTERSRRGCRRGREKQKGAPGEEAAVLHKT